MINGTEEDTFEQFVASIPVKRRKNVRYWDCGGGERKKRTFLKKRWIYKVGVLMRRTLFEMRFTASSYDMYNN